MRQQKSIICHMFAKTNNTVQMSWMKNILYNWALRIEKKKKKRFESVYKVLACAVGLVDHRLDDPSPGIDKPDGAKQRTVEMSIKAHLFFINVLASFKGKRQ